jgi:hypothetical protein
MFCDTKQINPNIGKMMIRTRRRRRRGRWWWWLKVSIC